MMNIGIQLFGCMEIYSQNPEAFLAKLAQAGFSQIEPCISFGEIPGGEKFTWKASEVAAYTRLASKYNLSLSSCHVFAKDLKAVLPEMLETAQENGIKQYVVGFHGKVNRENLAAFRDTCVRVSDTLSAHDIELWLHNGSAEIVGTQIDGVSAAQWLLKACDGMLGMQVDTGWVVCSGTDLRKFMTETAPYIRSIHHKDLLSIPANGVPFINTAIGDGIVDSAFACTFALEHQIGQIVDQDNSAEDILTDLKKSVAYLKQFSTK